MATTQLKSSSDSAISFSFTEFHAQTPDLPGPERMEVFYELPKSLQWLAWHDLAERMKFRRERDHEDAR